MFGRLRSIESWGKVMRRLLVAMAVLMLAPAGLVTVVALGFMFAPAAIVGIPFMVPALFGGANAERVARISRAPQPVLRLHGV